ncbi:MAG: hypothetical protein HRT71_18655 [Flavobacteriales bacterium]|nr:hypothetical protein [Flavobacteriales bacterium]
MRNPYITILASVLLWTSVHIEVCAQDLVEAGIDIHSVYDAEVRKYREGGHVLYLGVDNPVSITIDGVRSDKLTVYTSTGSVEFDGSQGCYLIKPVSEGKLVLNVTSGNNGAVLLTERREYTVKEIPEVTVKVSNQAGGNITTDKLAKAKVVKPFIRYPLSEYAVVKLFTFEVIANRELVYSETVVGNKLTEKMKAMILKRNAGDMVLFKKIEIVMPDGTTASSYVGFVIEDF